MHMMSKLNSALNHMATYICNNEGIFYSALTLASRSHHVTLLPPAHQAHKSFLKPSRLPGDYTAQLLPFRRIGLIKHNNQLCPHRYPFTPGWREAIMVKCLVQGHKHRGLGQGSNPTF